MGRKQAIDDETLQRVAEVCRLKMNEAEREKLSKDLNSILDYFSQINEIQEKGRELYYVREIEGRLREDEERACGEAEEIRSQFSKSREGRMLAPKSL